MMIQFMIAKLFLIFLWAFSCEADRFDIFTQEMADIVNDLADKTLEAFSKFDDQCLVKSYNQCDGSSLKRCLYDYPTPDGCIGQGMKFAINSTINLKQKPEKQLLSNEDKHVICKTAELQQYFQDLNEKRKGRFVSTYIGTSGGMTRSYPSNYYESSMCYQYDPRLRGWYTSSITGKKQIVILIDTSNSMQSHMKTMLKTVNFTIQSLTKDDLLLMYTVGDSVERVTQNGLTQMNETSKEKIQQNLNKIFNQGGQSNLHQGLTTAYQVLAEARKSDILCCPKNKELGPNHIVFMIFTDEVGQEESNQIKKKSEEWQEQFKSQFFSFSFVSSDINDINPQDYTCNRFGESYLVPTNASNHKIKDFVQKTYATMGKDKKFDKPVWSTFYYDYSGDGLMSTVSKPIYYSQDGISYLVGVAAIDVSISQFQKFFDSIDEAERRLINSNQYQIVDQDVCRQIGYMEPKPPFKNITGEIFAEPQSKQSSQCCLMTKEALIGIIVGIVVLVGIVIGIGIYCFCKKKKLKQQNKSKEQKEEQIVRQETERPISLPFPYQYPIPYPQPSPINYQQLKFPLPPPEVLV